MGHTRLGRIPKSQKWDAIVALMADGTGGSLSDSICEIAALTLDAASTALENGKGDAGLQYTFYLLTQIALAAREGDWNGRLAELGINLGENASIFDLASEVQYAIDDYVSEHRHATDISEMAQQAAGEVLVSLAGDRSVTLFGSGNGELQTAVRELSTKSGVSRLGQAFFGRFTARFLDFYLSRITASQAGGDRLRNVGDISAFNSALRAHCEQSAKIVHDFCGGWYSKTEYEQGIDLRSTSRFMAVAMRKMSRELAKQRAEL